MNPPPFQHHDAPVTLFDTVTSTNDLARDALLNGHAPHGAAFIAREQTRGRGRRGHLWHSPPTHHALYISVALIPDCEPHALPQLSLAIGLAMTLALEDVTPARPRLKWPNDLILGHRKVGGVLCESVFEHTTLRGVIAGVGVNLGGTRDTLPPDLHATATTLASETGQPATDTLRLDIARAFLQHTLRLTHPFDTVMRASMRKGWMSRAWIDTPVGLEDGRTAIARGIDDHGALILEDPADGSRFTLNSGTLRWFQLGTPAVG